MKQLLTFLAILLAAGLSCKSFAADAFDASTAGTFAVQAETAMPEAEAESEPAAPLFFFTRSIRARAASLLDHEFGFTPIHGEPLPGVLISLLLGAAFGVARKFRAGRTASESEPTAEEALPVTARLLRMQILFLNPPQTIHTISPGPDLFSLRE